MARVRIKNVGPIREGLTSNNGFIEFKGVTFFTGNQGSGKSTIAKIFSTLTWIEKAIVRGDFTANYICQYNRFKKQLAYQNISNYLGPSSEIVYEGDSYRIEYKSESVHVSEMDTIGNYKFPKIMYVPAERNFVSAVDRPDLVKRLPLPLYTFLEEYDAAKQEIGAGVDLPIGNAKFEYRKQNKKSWLVGPDYRIDLLEASSGYQSVVPLILVTRHLSKILSKEGSYSRSELSVDEEKRLRREIDKIFGNQNITDDVRRLLLEQLSSRYRYSCFVNIVEEPEQNLYPISQKEILFELLDARNHTPENRLIITTHSPYIINLFTLCVKAHLVASNLNEDKVKLKKLASIIPSNSWVSEEDYSIYQISDEGRIQPLSKIEGLPSDDNRLNMFLSDTNETFINLLNIEMDAS